MRLTERHMFRQKVFLKIEACYYPRRFAHIEKQVLRLFYDKLCDIMVKNDKRLTRGGTYGGDPSMVQAVI